MNSWKYLCSILLIAGFILSAQAQNQSPQKQKPQEDETIRIETELVQFEITVTDKQGKLIRDLKREDFELKEDGKIQEISYFSVGTSARPASWISTEAKKNKESVAPLPTNEIRAGRYVILAVDDLHLAFANLTYAKQAMLRFVEQQMAADDQVALITTSGQLGLFQQFTNDREILKRAINRLTLRERTVLTNPSDIPRLTPYQAELIDSNLDPDALAIAVNEIIRQMPGTTRQSATSMAQTKARQIVAENTTFTKATLSTLENIIRGLRGLPGRKSLILVSDGFLLGGTNQGTQDQLRKITDAATRSGLVIYAIDARGLVAMTAEYDASQPGFGLEQPPGARSRIESTAIEAVRDGLNALSRDTGGFPVFNNNDLSLGLQKVIDDTETYYLLAFEPTVSYRDGRFRKLEVRVKNHPEYKVRSTKGYFAPDDKAVAKAAEKELKEKAKLEEARAKNPEKAAKKESAVKVEQVREALGSLFPLRGIPVEMSVDFVDSGKGDSFAAILAHIDLSDVNFELANDRHNANIEVIGAIYNEKGDAVENFAETAQMKLRPGTYEKVKNSGVIFQRRVALKPGFYQARIAIRNEAKNQLGSASAWVEIPDMSKKQLALSSIFLALDQGASTVNPLDQKAEKKMEDQPPVQKPAQVSRRFKRSEKLDFTIFAYNAKTDAKGGNDIVIQTQVYSGTKLALATPLTKMNPSPDNPNAPFLLYAARLLLDKFEPGTYELRTVVVDRIAKLSAKRSVIFRVE